MDKPGFLKQWGKTIFYWELVCLFDPTAVSCKIQLEVLIVYADWLCCRQSVGDGPREVQDYDYLEVPRVSFRPSNF